MAYKTTNPATGLVTESFDNISDGALAASLDELERLSQRLASQADRRALSYRRKSLTDYPR